MATIVRHKKRNALFLLLGAGYGSYQSQGRQGLRPEFGDVPMAAICDFKGRMDFVASDNIEVVSIDGEDPETLLRAVQERLGE